MIKAVFFDFDGTIADTSPTVIAGYRGLFKEYRPDFELTEEFLTSLLGPALKQVFPLYFKEDATRHEELVACYRKYQQEVTDKEHMPLYPHVVECFKKLHEMGIYIVVVSSRKISSILYNSEILGIDSYYDYVVGSDSVVNFKPDPEAFNIAMKHYNLEKDECFMVGDHMGDIKGAKNAGIYSVGVSYSLYGKDNLIKDGADRIIDDMLEIIDIVGELNGK